MSERSIISPQSTTTVPAVAKDAMPVPEQIHNETDSQTFQKLSIQCKLSIGSPNDPLEHEADAMADTIMRMPQQNFLQRKCTDCEEEKVHRKPLASFIQKKGTQEGMVASDSVSNRIGSSRGKGKGLPKSTKSFMEGRFGTDFSNVNIHTGGEAVQMNRELNAKAFTVGNDIYFNKGQYKPNSGEGKHLLAHELTHTVQQEGISINGKKQINRSTIGGTEEIHNGLIEQYRQENGYPPGGIDSSTGTDIGPTDMEIRFGGLLDAWLLQNGSRSTRVPQPGALPTSVPPAAIRSAPVTAPSITPMGTTNVVAACQSATNVGACRQHQNYVQNILPQAITNIRAVSSPYSNAIAAMYSSALPQAQAVTAPVPAAPPATFGTPVNASGGPVVVTFGTTTHTFTRFTISLQQFPNGANGQAFGAGGPIAFISLNELSSDALLRNLSGIEETMVHEAMHILMEIVETANQSLAAGAPLANPNLDRSSYAVIQTGLESALIPFIGQIRMLPSFVNASGTAQRDASLTARSFLSEAIARVEAGVFVNQRAGRVFTSADVRALPSFFQTSAYWMVTQPVSTSISTQDMTTFIRTNQTQIDTAIQPFIFQAGDNYLNLRP